MTPVAIVGIGCICALGSDYRRCMQALFAGRRSSSLPTRFPAHCEASQPVFEVPAPFLPRSGASSERTRTCRMAMVATREALDHGGIDAPTLSRHRVGVCLGTNIGVTAGYAFAQQKDDAFLLPRDRFLATNPTHLVADTLDLNGPQQTVANACTAGIDAIGVAAAWIDQGICDAVIAGGSDELTPRVYFGFKSLFINDERPCRPFDRDRRGLNLGEGAAVFILASLDFCRSQGITPRGYILGYGSTADADHFTQPRADGRGLRLAIDESLSQAGLDHRCNLFHQCPRNRDARQ
jgi:3-oxoacyl-[acyl-carrier-protein] synthase II